VQSPKTSDLTKLMKVLIVKLSWWMYGGADLEYDGWLVVLGQWCCVYSWLCSNELYVSRHWFGWFAVEVAGRSSWVGS
jgi:hypothetical protein